LATYMSTAKLGNPKPYFARPFGIVKKEIAMTGKERLTAALKGEAVDRVPVCLRGFPVGEELPPGDHFTKAWKSAKEYRELFEDKQQYVDAFKVWHLAGPGFRPYSEMDFTNRHALVAPQHVRFEEKQISENEKRYEGWVDTSRGRLTYQSKVARGEHQAWRVEHIAKTLDDIIALVELPWSFDVNDVDFGRYHTAHDPLGDQGVVSMFITDPIVTISGCIDFQDFLMLAFQEPKTIHELIQEMTNRTLKIIDGVFKNRELDTTITIGGSEQIRPPMLSDQHFDEYVVQYTSQIVKRLKEYGLLVHCHCHGRVKTVLNKFIEMGYDSIDPVEPPHQGDLTYAEARDIVGDRLTLVGNLEAVEMLNETPAYIRKRVKEILSLGKNRVVISDSAPPVAAYTQKQANNYRAMIDAALEFGS
jgi:uroporphyrinogen-III decarboxylase